MGENLWLKYDSGRLFILDIDPHKGSGGVCEEVGPEGSNANHTVKRSKPEKVSAEQAVQIPKSTRTKYVFNWIETSGNEITYITTV
jgi:hypothetical protein